MLSVGVHSLLLVDFRLFKSNPLTEDWTLSYFVQVTTGKVEAVKWSYSFHNMFLRSIWFSFYRITYVIIAKCKNSRRPTFCLASPFHPWRKSHLSSCSTDYLVVLRLLYFRSLRKSSRIEWIVFWFNKHWYYHWSVYCSWHPWHTTELFYSLYKRYYCWFPEPCLANY